MLAISKLLSLIRIRIKNWSTYRFDFLASIVGMILPIVGFSLYWLDTFNQSTVMDNFAFTRKSIIVYYIIVFTIEMIFSYELAFTVEEDISAGKMNSYLVLPCNYITIKLSEFIAGNLLPFLLLITLVVLISLTSIASISFGSIVLFLLFIALGVLFHFIYVLILGLVTVWLKNISGMLYFLQTITGLFAGTVIPLNILPDHLRWVLWNPFSLSVFFPSQILLTGSKSYTELIVLGLWCLITYALYRVVWRCAQKNYEAFGG